MSDEKIIRISADASSFGAEINRVGQEAKRAFSDIGLDSLFDDADSQFSKFEDKIRSITDALKDKKREADDDFDKRKGTDTGNDYFKRTVDTEQEDYNKRHEKAMGEWGKFVDKLSKSLNKKGSNQEASSTTSEGVGGDNKDLRSILSKSFGNIGGEIGNSIGRILPGNMGRSLGNQLGNVLSRGGKNIGGSMSGGGVGAAAEGGLAAEGAAAGGGGAALAGVAVVAVVAAVAMAIKQLYGMGMEDWKTESKVNSTFNIDRDTFGRGGDAFGMDNKEYKEFILGNAKSRGSANDIENYSRRSMSLIKGYGISENEAKSFDKFNYQDVTKRDGSMVIVDILSRAEKQGILGVSAGDFSRLPEKLEQVASIMSIQKMSGEKVNSLAATNFMAAGAQIGGRFGDDRAGEVYGRMNESIKNPSNPGMKAYIYQMLRKSNPNSSFTDIQGMMEDGASGDNLKAILPQISKMPQGEMRRMVLYQLTKNMQDAIRLDGAGNLDAMTKEVGNTGISSSQAQKSYNEAMNRTETNQGAYEQLGKIITNSLTNFGEKYIARPMNDDLRSDMKGGGLFSEKTFDSNKYGKKQNAVTPKIP